MDTGVVAAIAAAVGILVGLLVGAAAAASFRRNRDGDRSRTAASQLPPGAVDVLGVLRSSAIVLAAGDRVVKASPAAYALGIVRGDALVSDVLRDMVRRVRVDRETREADLQIPRGPLAPEDVRVAARVAPLGADFVVVLVEDRTQPMRVEAVRRDFVANVSHELKTPVGALRLLAEAVSGASDDPEAVRRFAGRMLHEAERLSVLVQDIIDLSRLQGQDALREPHVVDIDHVVTDAIDRCRLAALAKDITIVSGGDAGVRVLGEGSLLVTALRNLVDNAVNYSPEHTRVAVAVRRSGDVVEVSVTDQGIGIPERELERIFERFYRVDPARSRATGGTGLGLSIVKHVVANHGGELSVWSVEGAGSTFTMRLPVGAAATDIPDQVPVREATP